jgi:C1A family cysteine protease
VKDQEGCNASYAFAAVADIESKMLIAGADAGPFSENHAKECNWEALTSYQDPSGAKWGTCHQGNARMAANLFSQQGTVLASCDPYDSSEVPCNATCPIQKTVLGWSVLSGGAVPPVDRLKESIYSYGPVQTTMYEGYNDDWGEEFSSYDGAYTLYYAGTEEPNHNVLIVGWDDSLSHKGGTGGWIVKNSVGTFWGTDGYFTIAYGSASIGMNSSFFSAWQDYDPEGELLFYDEAGWTDQFGFGNSTAWGLCRFVPDRDGQVSRVEFWTTDATTDVDVYLYDRWIDEVGPRDLLSSQFNLSYAEAGYHSALLDQAVPVTNGDEVVVVLKFTNAGPSYVPPVAIDALPEHSETGRTYISRTGADGSWEDVGVMVNSDIAVRLRLSGVVIPPSATPTPTRTAVATATPSRTPTEVATRGQIYLPVVQRGL